MRHTLYIAPALRETIIAGEQALLSNSNPAVGVGETPTDPSQFGTKSDNATRYNVWDEDWSK